MTREKDICILSVDDHSLVLQGLKRTVERLLPEIKTVCMVSLGWEASFLVVSQCFNLSLLDMELSDLSDLEVIPRIREKDPQTRIIVNTMYEGIWFIRNLIQCDVDGILFRPVDSNKIVEAIRCVLDDGTYYCTYAEQVRNQMRRLDEGRCEKLTQRELNVLKCISEGENTQGIVQDLCVPTNTIDTHRCRLLDKLDVKNVADLITAAISRGTIPIRKR